MDKKYYSFKVMYKYGFCSSIKVRITINPESFEVLKRILDKWYGKYVEYGTEESHYFHYMSDPEINGNIVSFGMDTGSLEKYEVVNTIRNLLKRTKKLG